MFFAINPHSGLAIYEQIIRQMKFAVANRVLRPGELVPSVRELARRLAVNPNTVARAYRELQAQSILEAVRGTGLQVTASAPKQCEEQRIGLIRERLRGVLREARQSGLAQAELKRLFNEEVANLDVRRPSQCQLSSGLTM